ncbi:MAG TPA: hypothetical protein DCL73_17095 [Treponema sp.]|nr:hypothetical protein [Treponema sp.]
MGRKEMNYNRNRNILFLLLYVPSVFLCLILIGIQIRGLYISANTGNLEKFGMLFRSSFIIALLLTAFSFAKKDFSSKVETFSNTDVTGIRTKQALEEKIDQLDKKDSLYGTAVIIMDLNGLKYINDHYGHDKGDEFIFNFARYLKQAAPEKFFTARFGGDEFVSICEDTTENEILTVQQKIVNSVNEYNKNSMVQMSFAFGYAVCTEKKYLMIKELFHTADQNMYKNKQFVKNQLKMFNARKDPLTGLFTNDSFIEIIQSYLNLYGAEKKFAVIYTSFSYFNFINTVSGYDTGNNLLKRFSLALQNNSFIVCSSRINADNFASLADITGKSQNEIEQMLFLRNSLLNTEMKRIFDSDYVSLHSGIYYICDGSMKAIEMLNHAKTAMHSAAAKNQLLCAYTPDIEKKEQTKMQVITSFRKALDAHEFQVYIQPIINPEESSIKGAEALSRWIRNGKIFKMPDEYIPYLEENGEIIALDYYVYNKVFAWLAERHRQNLKYVTISLNISRAHLQKIEPLVEYIQILVSQYSVPPEYIVFELTESMYMQNEKDAEHLITLLHTMGFKVSMDDFGSGYSSLRSLKNLLFDEIKIDREFISDNISSNEQAILKTVIRMLKEMEKTIVCEGVENQKQLDFLRGEKCNYIQGYFYSKPFPISDFPEYVNSFSIANNIISKAV